MNSINFSSTSLVKSLPHIPSNKMEIVLIIAKIAGAIIVFSAIATGLGQLLKISGAKLMTCAIDHRITQAVIQGGNGLSLIGKYAFLSVGVPVYFVTWVVPKWIIQEGIPEIAKLSHRYVIIPLYRGLSYGMKLLNSLITKVAHFIHNYILAPLFKHAQMAVKWIWNTVVIPLIDHIANAIHFLAKKIYTLVLEPLSRPIFHIAKWVYRAVIIPTAQKLLSAIDRIKDLVIYVAQKIDEYLLPFLQHLMNRAIEFSQWVWKTICIPLINQISSVFGTIRELIITTAKKIYEFVLSPLGHATQIASKWLLKTVILPLGHQIRQGASMTMNLIIHVANKINAYALSPIGSLVKESSKWIWKCIAMPIVHGIVQLSSFLKDHLVQLSQKIYEYVIRPSLAVIETAIDYSNQSLHALASSISESYFWLSQKISG